jgi:iron complex outermembrane recepter protein
MTDAPDPCRFSRRTFGLWGIGVSTALLLGAARPVAGVAETPRPHGEEAAGTVVPKDVHRSGNHTVAGRIVCAMAPAAPMVGASVTIVELDRQRLTNRAGQFRLDGVPAGEYTIRIEHVGHRSREMPLLVPDPTPLEIAIEPSVFVLDAVVATASPYGSTVGYQPVQALDREALQRRSATSLGEVLESEPGVAMSSVGNVTGRPVIRGLGYERVLVLENGERMGDAQETGVDHAVTMDPLGADRIEIVRGPASVLYGSQAMGGVVNVISEDIPRSWSHGLSGGLALQGASVNDLRAGFGRVVYGSNRWSGTARGSFRETGVFRTPLGELPFTQSSSMAGSVGATYAGDTFDGGIALGLLELVYGIPPEPGEERERVEIRTQRRTAQARAEWKPGGLVQNVEWRLHASRYWQEEWELEMAHGGVIEDAEEVVGLLKHSLSSTVTVRHAPAGPFDRGAVGVQLFVQSGQAWGIEARTPDARRPQLGVFSFQELPLTERIRLQMGARLDLDRVTTRANERFPDAYDSRNAITLSGALGANFQSHSGLELGIQLSRAHRSPLLEELYVYGAHLGASAFEIGDPLLKNEVGRGLDLFVRATTRRTQFETAVFHNELSNYIVLQPTGDVHHEWNLPIVVFEADRAVLKGLESTVEARLPASLRLRVSGDYVHATRGDGMPLPFIPPARARVALTHEGRAAWLGGNTHLVSAQKRVAKDEEATDGYLLVGGEFGYRIARSGRHVLSLRIDNALDTAYKDHLTRIENRENPMPGRNFNMMYRWVF